MSKIMYCFLSLHLFIVVFVNVNHLTADYYDIYHPKAQRPMFTQMSNRIFDSAPFSIYSAYSGTNSSYGFYAPTVGSEFIYVFGLYNRKKLFRVFTGPDLRQSESALRYSLCTLPVQDMLMDSTSIAASYLRVMLHEMSRYALKQDFGSDLRDLSVTAKVRMYKYPTTNEYLSGKRHNSVLVKKYDFEKFN